ncbi:DNA repair protein RecO [Mycoplasma seminis]|uniref:DNA repair protein RecO n=1 Tax=Mycoplasma seminis TaxID=512749 RepID=A0ABY9H9W8_9MOLU|nr:DNA repair protein RecO [Mycoplasma seminis]WLP85367.1 DNA repair protein RecO [Mycoplasma seminis]
METIERVIVLDINQYEENKFLVTFFGQRGAFALYAQGLGKINSKNRSNLLLGSIVEIEYFKARFDSKVGKLKKSTLIKTFDTSKLENSLFFNKLKQLLSQIHVPSHLFSEYDRYFDEFSNYNQDKILTYFLAQVLVINGYCNYFNKCRICGSTRNFIAFDVELGGFTCIKHEDIQEKMSLDFLQSVWASFHNLNSYQYLTSNILNKQIMYIYLKSLRKHGIYLAF